MKTILTIAVGMSLAGCASQEFKQAQADHYRAQADIQKAHAAQEATPLLALTMGDDGKLKSLIVGRQQSQLQYAPAPVDSSIQIWDRALSTVGLVAAPFAVLRGSASLINSVGSVVKNVQPGPIPQANITTTNTTTSTLSGTGTLGGGSYSNTTPTTTTTLSGTGALGGNYTPTTTDRHDAYTAPPTVVTQPSPLIVTQPAPLIVNPVIVP